jgi:integrase
MSKIKNWIMPGCTGRFYVRGINNIIWYRRGTDRKSLSLPYSTINRKIAADIIIHEENPEVYKPKTKETLNDKYIEFLNEKMLVNQKKTLRAKKTIAIKYFDKTFYINETNEHYNYVLSKFSLSTNNVATLNNDLKMLNTFYNYLLDKDIIKKNPFKSYKIKVVQRGIITYTDKEIEKIFDYFKNDEDMYYIIKILYYTAFRVMELMNMKWEQIYSNGQYLENIKLTSKYKDRQEMFPLTEELKNFFDNFKKDGTDGKVIKAFAYSTAHNKMAEAFKILNIKKNYSSRKENHFHYLRATRITKWAEQGLSAIIISKLSRDNIDTVMKYYSNVDNSTLHKYL